jgi:hypothetical protein
MSNTDEIAVVFPSIDPPHKSVTDMVSRREFLARMDGTNAADQLKGMGDNVRVVTLMEVESLHQWLITRSVPDA